MSFRGLTRSLSSSFGEKSEDKVYQRRRHDMNLSRMTSVEIVSLEQSVEKVSWEDRVKPFIPLLAWSIWILLGSCFYGFHYNFPWDQALFMSVNIGWSMGWVMEWEYERTAAEALFSTCHCTVGVVFIGTAVIYIAQEVGKNQDDWLIQMMKKKELALAAETEGYKDDIIAFFTYYLPKLKIFIVFLGWFVMGIVWYVFTLPTSSSSNGWQLIDFVLSTLSGGGYLAIETNSNRLQYVVTAMYTTIGVPLMSIALGLLLSLLMEAPEDKSIFEKIVAGVTEEEIEFMKIFEIDDGDGTIDSKEFIILTVVRIGAAPPQLINQIHCRFDILDRQHTGKITYDDLVVGWKKKKMTPQNSGFGTSFRGMLKNMSSSDTVGINDTAAAAAALATGANGSLIGSRGRSNSGGGGGGGGSDDQQSIMPLGRVGILKARVERVNSISRLKMTRQTVGCLTPSVSVSDMNIDGEGGSKIEIMEAESQGDQDLDLDRETDIEMGLLGPRDGSGTRNRGRSMSDVDAFVDHPPTRIIPVTFEEQKREDEPRSYHEYELEQDQSTGKQENKNKNKSNESIETQLNVLRQHSRVRTISDDADTEDKDDKMGEKNSENSLNHQSIASFRSISSFGDGDSDDDDGAGDCAGNNQVERRGGDSNNNKPCLPHPRPPTPPPPSKTKHSTWRRMQTLSNLLPSSLRGANASATISPRTQTRNLHKSSSMSALMSSDASKAEPNKEVLEKLQKAKELMKSRQLQNKRDANNKATLLLSSKQAMKSLMRNVYFFCFGAWFCWLLLGTLFYSFHENVSIPKGMYISVSVGYGIFWIPLKRDNISRAFTTFHFIVGIFAIALAMAIFARTLISAQKNWYVEAMNKRKFEEARETDGYKDDVIAAFVYYWPKLKIYFYFFLWTLVGIAFCLGTGQLSFVDSLYFSVATMSTGGFLNIDYSSPNWQFMFVSIYVVIGVPIMAIACGLLAHQIASIGATDKLEEKINAQVTEEELMMMKVLKIEDGDGCIDGTEFTILVLVRIGALNPDLIGVLYERFNDLDVKKEGKITYDDLQRQHEEGGTGAMKGMLHTGKIHTRLGYG